MAAKRLADHRSLVKSQAVSTVEFDRLQEQGLLARKLVERHEAGVAKIERELKAAKQGVFIQKDSPYFEQRTVDLAQRIPIVEAELKEVDEMLVAVDNEVEGEQKRLEQLAEATASSPVSGTVWKRFGNLGQIVKQHETLYEIADGGGIFVEALLHQRFLSEVTPGCRATINLTGGRTVTGHVRAVRTNTPTETESACAMTMSDRDLKQVRVIIDFDPPLQDAQLIGRHVRVLITNPEPSLVQRTVMWLFASLRAG